jgi:hypothetical protein
MRRRELPRNQAALGARLVLFLAILPTLLQAMAAAAPASARWFDGYLAAAMALAWMSASDRTVPAPIPDPPRTGAAARLPSPMQTSWPAG